MAGVLSTVLVAGGVVGIVEVTKPKGVTPASINAAMAKFCGKNKVHVTLGIAAITNRADNDLKQSQPAAEAHCGPNSGLYVLVYFFRSSFDENKLVKTLVNRTYWKPVGNRTFHLATYSIGKGFVATFRYPNNGASFSEGQVVNWATSVFGVVPKSSNFATQHWTETLPPITLESFGSPKPTVYKP